MYLTRLPNSLSKVHYQDFNDKITTNVKKSHVKHLYTDHYLFLYRVAEEWKKLQIKMD